MLALANVTNKYINIIFLSHKCWSFKRHFSASLWLLVMICSVFAVSRQSGCFGTWITTRRSGSSCSPVRSRPAGSASSSCADGSLAPACKMRPPHPANTQGETQTNAGAIERLGKLTHISQISTKPDQIEVWVTLLCTELQLVMKPVKVTDILQ